MQPVRIPSLNWLRVFDAAARHQSFASAGRELNMSAAAVSQQILALETYLKKPLFVRSANRVRLTVDGSEFLPTLQASLRAIEAKMATLFPRKEVERVTLVASQLMAMSWLPRILFEFEQKHASVRVDLIMEDVQRQFEPDLVLRFDQGVATPRHPGWLMGLTHVAVGSPENVAAITGPEDLAGFRLFDVRSHAVGWNTVLTRYADVLDSVPLTIESVDTTPLALMMVKEGAALALVPWPASQHLAVSLGLAVCHRIQGVQGLGNYCIEQPAGRLSRPAVAALVQDLRAAAKRASKAALEE